MGWGLGSFDLFAKQFSLELDSTACVKQEYCVGPKSEDSGGRIDILIRDKHNPEVVIENKINAADQEKQISRYLKTLPRAKVFLLTLSSVNRANRSNAKDRERLACISYAWHILPWLEACRKEAALAPLVRETITQYIHLIQRLTRQNTSTRMNQALSKQSHMTRLEKRYLAYASLRNANRDIRNAIIAKVNAQLETLGKELGLTTLETFAAQSKTGENYFYTTPAMEAKNLKFGLRCAGSEYTDFAFGFAYIKLELKSQLDASLLGEAFTVQSLSNDFWHAYGWWNQTPRRSSDDETMAAIISGEFAPDLVELIRKLATAVDQASRASADAT